MEKVLECLLRLGQKIYQTEDQSRIDTFNDQLIAFGFVYPGEAKVDDEWQVQINHNHLKISTF